MPRFLLAAALSLCALLAGCATSGPRPDAKSAATAAERARERWQALIDGRADLAYAYLTPGARSTKSLKDYVAEAANKPLSYQTVNGAEETCEPESCIVTVDLEYEVQIPLAGIGKQRFSAAVDERWIRLDGTWYFLPDALR